jgi:23S rRNA (pseudouridine1915-N3)-methyltransferase
MQFMVATVGQRMPSWVQEAWTEYARRFARPFSLELCEIPMARRSAKSDIERLREQEGQALLAAVPSGFRVIAMDERGKQWSTMELASRMENWMMQERGVCLLVGGPDGLPPICRHKAQDTWSLGRLTFPHPLVRVVLGEQLYRAWSITRNHPYHRA